MPTTDATFDRLTAFLSTDPIGAAGNRALKARAIQTELPQERSVPFLRSLLFLILLALYLIASRLMGILRRKHRVHESYDHVFTVTSAAGYRSWPQPSVARELTSRGHDICILSTSSAGKRRHDWEAIAPVYPHRSLHAHIPIRRTIGHMGDALRTTTRLFSILQHPRTDLRSFAMCGNTVFLDYIKYALVQDLLCDAPVIHAMKPDPYPVASTALERIIVYQYGMIHVDGHYVWSGTTATPAYPFTMAIPYFSPVQYAVWDDISAWEYQKIADNESQITVTGSP